LVSFKINQFIGKSNSNKTRDMNLVKVKAIIFDKN